MCHGSILLSYCFVPRVKVTSVRFNTPIPARASQQDDNFLDLDAVQLFAKSEWTRNIAINTSSEDEGARADSELLKVLLPPTSLLPNSSD